MLMSPAIPRSFKVALLIALAGVALLLACLKLAPPWAGASPNARVQALEHELRQLRQSGRGSQPARLLSPAQLEEEIRRLKAQQGKRTPSTEELERRLKELRRS